MLVYYMFLECSVVEMSNNTFGIIVSCYYLLVENILLQLLLHTLGLNPSLENITCDGDRQVNCIILLSPYSLLQEQQFPGKLHED